MSAIYLTKSRYLAGLQCPLRLWLGVHEPGEREEPEPGSALDVGLEIGRRAHLLFPGGVLVDEPPWEHDAAVGRTARLMADKSVPAIFEAAFTHDGIRVRVDVLERLLRGWWGLREVKGSSRVKDTHLDDVALQVHVLKEAGVRLSSVEVVHVDTSYVRDADGIDWRAFFRRVEVKGDLAEHREGLPERVAAQMAVLRKRKSPVVAPGAQCSSPYDCEFRDRCTADKPEDWIAYLPRLRADRLADLEAKGIEAVRDIPADYPLTAQQRVMRDAIASGRPFVAPGLKRLLAGFGPPSLYLDFEAMAPAIPLYAGTRPYQALPFQWSLHRLGRNGALTHDGFLAPADGDPRRAFAETLIAAVGGSSEPILVYSPYEQTRLKELAAEFPDLAPSLHGIVARLRDLLPVVRGGVYFPGFDFGYSIKVVARALSSGFGYTDLDDVADGAAAAWAFQQMASGDAVGAEAERLRTALLAYCERDTLAMVETHRALIRLAGR